MGPAIELKPGMKYNDHILKSRRDFLSQGLIIGSAAALMPTALDLVIGNALAQSGDCVFNNNPVGLTPVIIFDLAGGSNFSGSNILVGGQAGQTSFIFKDGAGVSQPIDYRTLGLPTSLSPTSDMIDSSLGLAFHRDSAILRGIKSVSDIDTMGKCDGMIFCTTSDNDTENNLYNPAYWLYQAGARGKLAGLAGTEGSLSGGRSQPAGGVNPALAPITLRNATDARGLTSLGKLGEGFDALTKSSKIDKILRATAALSDKKLAAVNRRNLPEALQKIVSCNISQTPQQIKTFDPNNLDPSRDPLVRAAFPDAYTKNTNLPNDPDAFVNANGNASERQRRVSTVGKLLLDGYVGVATVELGGYDYHAGGTRPEAEEKDADFGRVLGQLLNLARAKGKDIDIIVYTDGGVSASTQVQGPDGKLQWGGDNGERSAAWYLKYEHKAAAGIDRPAMNLMSGFSEKIIQRQIGHIKTDGANNNNALMTSNSTVNTAKAFVLNYLNYHNNLGAALNVLGDNPMANDINQYLGFAPRKLKV